MIKYEIEKEDIYIELDMIQNCISRMASNSFALKGWYIAVLTAMFAFIATTDKSVICLPLGILIVATIIFWYLDSYYLYLERKYREKYNWILENRVYSEDISKEYLFDLDISNNDKSESINDKGFIAVMLNNVFKLLYIYPLAFELVMIIIITLTG